MPDIAVMAARCAGYNDAAQQAEDARATGDRYHAEFAHMYMQAALDLWPEGGDPLQAVRLAEAASDPAADTESRAQGCQNLGLRLRVLTGAGFH